MNAESEMQRGDGLGSAVEPQGTIYALAVVLEADSREEAFNRITDEVGPEPASAHFVGEPFEIERADEYDTRSVADQLAVASRSPRCLFCNGPDGGATHCPHCGAYNRSEPLPAPLGLPRFRVEVDTTKVNNDGDLAAALHWLADRVSDGATSGFVADEGKSVGHFATEYEN